MATILQSDFDKLVSHTIRIELKNGSILIFYVSLESKSAFHRLLKNDIISDYENDFLWFYIPEDRLVLANKNEIIRITFCFDPLDGAAPKYKDNFNVIDISEEQDNINDVDEKLYLPQLIIMHNRQREDTEFIKGITMKTEGYFGNISSYSSLNKGDLQGFDFEYFPDEEEWALLTYKYLQFIDDDGEENFMPLGNLSIIEIERSLLMSDEILDLYLDKKPKKKARVKKK